jgi:hypothetical protein
LRIDKGKGDEITISKVKELGKEKRCKGKINGEKHSSFSVGIYRQTGTRKWLIESQAISMKILLHLRRKMSLKRLYKYIYECESSRVKI